jgi:hypothetical protein
MRWSVRSQRRSTVAPIGRARSPKASPRARSLAPSKARRPHCPTAPRSIALAATVAAGVRSRSLG